MYLVFMITIIIRYVLIHTKRKHENSFRFYSRIVEQKYDLSVKQIFLVLDNVSIHESNKVKQTMAKHHLPRI